MYIGGRVGLARVFLASVTASQSWTSHAARPVKYKRYIQVEPPALRYKELDGVSWASFSVSWNNAFVRVSCMGLMRVWYVTAAVPASANITSACRSGREW